MASGAQARLADALSSLDNVKTESAARESELLLRIKLQAEAHRVLELECAKLSADLTRTTHDADRHLQRALEAEDRCAWCTSAHCTEPMPMAPSCHE
jgi:hypothetical protein